jgi:predicted flap endonuclease-1-like 5' DNA nuclease
MSEDMLLTLLLLLFGGIAGVLLTLFIDGRYWQRRLRAVSGQRQQLKDEIRSLGQRLAQQQRELANRQSQLVAVRQQLQAKTAELERMEQALATNRQAIDQLTRQWEQAQTVQQDQAQTILTLRDEREAWQQAIHHLEKEQIRAETRHEAACQQLSRLERALRQAEQQLEESQQQAIRLAELERDKAHLTARTEAAETETAVFQAQANQLLDQLGTANQLQQQLQKARQRIAELQERLDQKREINQTLRNTPSHLEAISGIGPTYARRLREGGILSLSDLATADVDTLRKILKLQSWHGRDPQVWIDEAQRLVKQP